MTSRSNSAWLRALACAALVAWAGSLLASGPPALPADSVYQLHVPLTDQHGKTWDWGGRRGRPQIVAMFYSSCPNMCPLLVDSGKAVEHNLAAAELRQLQLLYISIDPAHDTPAVLAALAAKRTLDPARWTLASPRPQDVRSVAGLLGVRYRQLADGQFNHTSALLLLDRDGRIVARTERIGTTPDAEFLRSVHHLLR